MMFNLILSDVPELKLQEQIYQRIRSAILSGSLKPGTRLPSSRALADQIGVARNTVILAYDLLQSEGYVSTRRGAGCFVVPLNPEPASSVPKQAAGGAAIMPQRSRRRVPSIPFAAPMQVPVNAAHDIDFAYAGSDRGGFPLSARRRLTMEKLSRGATHFQRHGNPAGDPDLRSSIVDHLASARGIQTSVNSVVITAGSREGLSLLARVLLYPGATVIVEDPCHRTAAFLLESAGARLIPVPVDTAGLMVDRIPQHEAAFIHTMPSHQFPTGATLSRGRRAALLRRAAEIGAYVVENDYDCDFRYDEPPLAAVASLDRDDRVIHLGSFSRALGDGLRLGFMVLPEELIEPVSAAKSFTTGEQTWLDQAVVAEFIRTGAYARHLRRLRQIYRERRDTLVQALASAFGSAAVIAGAGGGMHVICQLAESLGSAEDVTEAASAKGVGIYGLTAAGARMVVPPPGAAQTLLLGYANLEPNEIAEGIARLGSVARPR